jgi:hypothetical protein
VNGCNSLVVVALHAPQLSKLELQELGDLKGACLQQVDPQPRAGGGCMSWCFCGSKRYRLEV